VTDAVNTKFNIDSYIKAESGDLSGFVDFGDNLTDDLRVDGKMLEGADIEKSTF